MMQARPVRPNSRCRVRASARPARHADLARGNFCRFDSMPGAPRQHQLADAEAPCGADERLPAGAATVCGRSATAPKPPTHLLMVMEFILIGSTGLSSRVRTLEI